MKYSANVNNTNTPKSTDSLLPIPELLMIWSLSLIPKKIAAKQMKIIECPIAHPIEFPNTEVSDSWKSPRTIDATSNMISSGGSGLFN